MTTVLEKRWPREIVVEHGDGTVSLFQDVDQVDWSQVRGRRAGDVFKDYPREEASGTARKAPSTLWEREPEARTAIGSVVGIQSAPPHAGLVLGWMGFGS